MVYKRAGVDDGTPRVEMGSHVELELIDTSGASEKLGVIIVPDARADFGAGFLGLSTPLAKAILTSPAGSTVLYGQGDITKVRILSVTPGDVPNTGADASRQATIKKAVDRSELEDTLRLALTVDIKWGDYDPDGLVPPQQEQESQ